MINKILVPLDGTPLAEKALPFAIRLANQYGASLVLKRVVFVNYLMSGELMTGDAHENLEVNVLDGAQAYLAKVKQIISDPQRKRGMSLAPEQIETILGYGKPVENIGDLINFEKVDFVVMSTHGRTGLGEVLVGSTAAGVVQHSPVPVMLIRPEVARGQSETTITLAEFLDSPVNVSLERTIRACHIVVTLDGQHFAENALWAAIDLSKAYGATIHIVEVITPPLIAGYRFGYGGFMAEIRAASIKESHVAAYQYLAEIQSRIEGQGLKCTTVALDGNPAEAITEYAASIGAMCLVMATHAAGRIGQLITGSTAQAVLHHSLLPVVMVHPVITNEKEARFINSVSSPEVNLPGITSF